MEKRWPPLESIDAGRHEAGPVRLAEERARLLALCWDDARSDEANLEIIGCWLDLSQPQLAETADY